jgi:2-dehydropantoate 2-reductase
MSTDNPRLLVIGGGVNGSVVAAGLQQAGVNVTLLARGQRCQALRAEGIVIEDPFKHTRRVTRVPVSDCLAPDDCYDYVLVVVRKNQVASLLPALAANHSPNIVFMGNNLAGPAEMVQALGQQRVLLGAVYAAGRREGDLIRAMVIKAVAAPFGEVDGAITPRLKRLAGILRQAGFKAELSTQMVDFQMTHAAGVAVIAPLALKHGSDTYALARATDDLRLIVAAQRETHAVLRALGHRIVPWSEAALERAPDWLQVAGLRALLNSKLGEVGLGWHCSQAPDEMRQLARELATLVEQAGLRVPAIRKVLALG